jgi:hypothetical protein
MGIDRILVMCGRKYCISVMPGLVPGIHAFWPWSSQDVDGRNKCSHDESKECAQ